MKKKIKNKNILAVFFIFMSVIINKIPNDSNTVLVYIKIAVSMILSIFAILLFTSNFINEIKVQPNKGMMILAVVIGLVMMCVFLFVAKNMNLI